MSIDEFEKDVNRLGLRIDHSAGAIVEMDRRCPDLNTRPTLGENQPNEREKSKYRTGTAGSGGTKVAQKGALRPFAKMDNYRGIGVTPEMTTLTSVLPININRVK